MHGLKSYMEVITNATDVAIIDGSNIINEKIKREMIKMTKDSG